jgi:hypothetical protein
VHAGLSKLLDYQKFVAFAQNAYCLIEKILMVVKRGPAIKHSMYFNIFKKVFEDGARVNT